MSIIASRKPLIGVLILILAAAASLIWTARAQAGGQGAARAVLVDQTGTQVGLVRFIPQQGAHVLVVASLQARTAGSPDIAAGVVSPGFKGFHIHAGSACAGDFVASAAGHYGHHAPEPGSTPHGTHEGDMPVLLINADGSASARFISDRVSIEEIRGRTVIVHAGADNYGNIPPRYGAPDAVTLATGDAGARYACGVIA